MRNGFLYPRVITIQRPGAPSEPTAAPVGKQVYQGVRRDTETLIAEGIPASIQYSGTSRLRGGEVPSDAVTLSAWTVFTPKDALAQDAVTERDIIVDDLGKRYQITAAYWTSMGFSMRATLLQV